MSNSFSSEPNDTPLYGLEDHGEFIMRHIGPRDEQVAKMLEKIGATSLDELISSTLPPSIQIDEPLDLPQAKTESETLASLSDMAKLNNTADMIDASRRFLISQTSQSSGDKKRVSCNLSEFLEHLVGHGS